MATAFIFPGQGSQAVGMLGTLAGAHPVVRETFDEAGAAAGFDLWRLVQQGPESELNQTANTQPALLAAAVALWRAWRARGMAPPAVLAGHSLGEYSALVCAEAVAFDDAVRLVIERGRCMQAAVPEGQGAMAAILGLDDAAVEQACVRAAGTDVVAPANYNAPGQVVIAGHSAAVQRAIAECKGAGARRAVLLPVSVPSHCELMRAAADGLRRQLDATEIADARIPVIQNVDATARTAAGPIRAALLEQLYRPVQWVASVRCMHARGVRRAVECGPGNVLAGLIRRIEPEMEVMSGADPEAIESVSEEGNHEQTA